MTSEKGFTLVEFLIAMVILMIGLLGLLQTINMAMEKNLETILRNEAYALANDRMMVKKGKTFDSLSTITTNNFYQRDIRGILKNYSVQEAVTTMTSPTNVLLTERTKGSKEINISVSWKYKKQRNTHSVSSVSSELKY